MREPYKSSRIQQFNPLQFEERGCYTIFRLPVGTAEEREEKASPILLEVSLLEGLILNHLSLIRPGEAESERDSSKRTS